MEGELDEASTCRKFRQVRKEGDRNVSREMTFYNLDMIISVGYRVRSQRGVQFRIWASNILKEYLRKGFAMDDERIKGNGGGMYWKELLDRIRDIRSSEKIIDNTGGSNGYIEKRLEALQRKTARLAGKIYGEAC